MKSERIMWAIKHVPSGSWHSGDANLLLYWAEHEAKLACANEAFEPVAVIVGSATLLEVATLGFRK